MGAPVPAVRRLLSGRDPSAPSARARAPHPCAQGRPRGLGRHARRSDAWKRGDARALGRAATLTGTFPRRTSRPGGTPFDPSPDRPPPCGGRCTRHVPPHGTLRQALWIGGGQGAGTTTVAHLRAKRYGVTTPRSRRPEGVSKGNGRWPLNRGPSPEHHDRVGRGGYACRAWSNGSGSATL